jgi:tryptophan 2,3-dioxygenase
MTRYYDYLKLDRVLTSQSPKSKDELGNPEYHELFFITIHQVYELWFKAILFELDSVMVTFKEGEKSTGKPGERRIIGIDERDVCVIVGKLNRIIEILKLLVAQIKTMETLTPLDFMDFRHFLEPASGYDSLQFRLIEVKLGLRLRRGAGCRWGVDAKGPDKYGPSKLAAEHLKKLAQAEEDDSLFDHVERWLRRTPFVKPNDAGDWFHNAVADLKLSDSHESVNLAIKNLKRIFDDGMQEGCYGSFIDMINHNVGDPQRKGLSHHAFLASIFIHLYRDEPILQQPHRLLESLKELDELFSVWRTWHSSMVLRIIGEKPGTGGKGYGYLARTAREYRLFPEFARVSTFLIPRARRPPMPDHLREHLDYRHARSFDSI